jgi:hypothetical protein
MARKTRKRKPTTVEPDGLLSLLQEMQPAKSADIADSMGANQLTVRAQLMALEKEGKAHRKGQTRGTRWYVGPSDGSEPTGTATAKRRRKSSDSFPPEAGDDGRRGPKERRLDEYKSVLGTVPDADIADKAGVSQRTVQNYRKRHGIGGFAGRGSRARVAAPAARTSKRTAAAGATVWKVDIATGRGTTTLYVVGSDLVSASQNALTGLASAGISGEIVGLSLVGSMI